MGRLDRLYGWFDDRLHLSGAQSILGKAFPAEDSFLLGEVALFCFLLLVLSGVFLGFFFEPSTSDVEYEGSVAEYQGEELPESFVSVLNITYDVPFGMLIRRMHHWAAHLFIASMALHMLRVFFTGAYRNPREPNWLVGTGLAGTSMFAAYTGYALPFDEFASTAVGIGYNVAHSIPLIGEFVSALAFGGDFPSSATIPRFYFLHVLVLPLVIGGLLAVHMAILVRQKHTEAQRDEDVSGPAAGDGARASASAGATGDSASDVAAADGGASGVGTADAEATDGGAPVAATGDGRSPEQDAVDRDDDSVVVGLPAFPNQAAVSAVVFFLTLATLSLLSGFLPVHNIAEYGPNDPASTPSLVMPDWFLMWGYGFLKLVPAWLSFDVLGVHVSAEFVGGLLLPGLVFGVVAIWPFIDYHDDPVHFTADPITRPWQTAVGIAGVVFILVASLAGMDVILADILGSTTAALKPVLIAALVTVPTVAGLVTYVTLSRWGVEAGGDGGSDGDDDGTATTASDDGATTEDAGDDDAGDDDAGADDATADDVEGDQ